VTTKAMRPTEMLLGALAGCTGMNAVLLLKKFKQPLKSLSVESKASRRMTAAGVQEDRDHVRDRVGRKHDKESVEKAIDLACNRYCPIHATLSHGTKSSTGTKTRTKWPSTAFLKAPIEIKAVPKAPYLRPLRNLLESYVHCSSSS